MAGPKILILTTNYGNGHLQVARSLEQELSSHSGNTVLVKDLFYETSPFIHEWTKKIYLKSFTPGGRQIYRLFYYSSKEISKRKNLKVLSYGYSKLCKIIDQEKPDLIINTFPSFAVPYYRSKTNSTIPTYNIITDYCLHHSWVHPNIDKYYVATKQLETELKKIGVSKDSICVSGMPIKKEFDRPIDLQQVCRTNELNPSLKTVLIVAGAYGVSKEMKEICHSLKEDPLLQLVIVCGRNKNLYKDFQNKYKDYKNIKVLGYVTDMEKLFRVSTIVITKPGGIILSEAMATNTPIVLTRATPGQESENAQFFQQQNAALLCEKVEDLSLRTKQLVRDEPMQRKMKQSLSKMYVPRAAEKISSDILVDYYNRYSQSQFLKL